MLITYDVKTLEKVSAMFESKEASQLTQLTAAARQKLEDLKKTSALGLEYGNIYIFIALKTLEV